MTKLEAIKQKIEADRQAEEQREAKKVDIRKQIAALDGQIAKEIDAGEDATAKKLIIKQNELKTELEYEERIERRKTDPLRYFDDIVEVSRDMVADMQPKADKVYAEMEKAHKTYLEKKAALAKILFDAAIVRIDCWQVAGICPSYYDARADEILSVQHDRYALDVSLCEKEQIQQIDPKFLENVSYANTYGQFK